TFSSRPPISPANTIGDGAARLDGSDPTRAFSGPIRRLLSKTAGALGGPGGENSFTVTRDGVARRCYGQPTPQLAIVALMSSKSTEPSSFASPAPCDPAAYAAPQLAMIALMSSKSTRPSLLASPGQ